MKFVSALQAKPLNIFKNTRLKLLKTNAAIWYNKMCKARHLQPGYISIHSAGKTSRDNRTIQQAVAFRINQEIKYLYQKKQRLNQQLYRAQLTGAATYKGMWQHALIGIEEEQSRIMELKYKNLQEKMDRLQNKNKNKNRQNYNKFSQNNNSFDPQPRIINLTEMPLTKEQLNILNRGPQYAMETNQNFNINGLIAETENAIKHIDQKWQNMYRIQASKHIKRIREEQKQNPLHKQQYKEIKLLRKELQHNNITIMKADKCKTLVLIDKEQCIEKVNNFLEDNNITKIPNDPTTPFQKQAHNIIKNSPLIIDKMAQKSLTQMQPKAPVLNALIKTHKPNMPIRPVVNNTHAPTHKLARHINKMICNWQILPNTFNTKNSIGIACELKNLKIKPSYRIITLDIKDLYTNLPTQGVLEAANYWMELGGIHKEEKKQMSAILDTIMQQNYFTYNKAYYKPQKGVAMGSPLSGTLAELYLQRLERLYIKHSIETKAIMYYSRYVDDIIIIFDTYNNQADNILQQFNSLNENLQFKSSTENNACISFLDLNIFRTPHRIDLGIYRKETSTDTTIHNKSNHPHEHRMAAYRFYIHRLLNIPLTKKEKDKEWDIIVNTAISNGFSVTSIKQLLLHMTARQNNPRKDENNSTDKRTWITFTYHGNYIRKITNMFKKTQIRIAFRTTNTTFQILTRNHNLNPDNSGIYELTCGTCQGVYIGQTGRSISIRYKEHVRYIKNNNPQSGYALHILNTRHEFGHQETIKLIKYCKKGKLMNTWESMYIQKYHGLGRLVAEQQRPDHNPLFDLFTFTGSSETVRLNHR